MNEDTGGYDSQPQTRGDGIAPMSLLSFGKPGVYFSGLGLAAGAAAWWLGTRNSQKAREADKKVSLRLNP